MSHGAQPPRTAAPALHRCRARRLRVGWRGSRQSRFEPDHGGVRVGDPDHDSRPGTGRDVDRLRCGLSDGGAFAYPADGSVVSARTPTTSAATSAQRFAIAKAESDVTGLSLFGGEITADGVTARASAGTGFSGAGGNQLGSAVTNLVALGQPVTGTSVALADWGTLILDATAVDRSAPAGTRGYQGRVVEVDVHLTATHAGAAGRHRHPDRLCAGSRPDRRPRRREAPTTATTTTVTTTSRRPPVRRPRRAGRPPRRRRPLRGLRPRRAAVPHTAGTSLDFPVFGPSAYLATFGAPRSHASYHPGDDIFGTFGQSVVAVGCHGLAVGYDTTAGTRSGSSMTTGTRSSTPTSRPSRLRRERDACAPAT